jgi:hypothetical protein
MYIYSYNNLKELFTRNSAGEKPVESQINIEFWKYSWLLA